MEGNYIRAVNEGSQLHGIRISGILEDEHGFSCEK